VELAPAELGANRLFADINHGILDVPTFNLTIDDARNFLLATPTRYDVIESDAVHPDIDIATYTKEYFEICRDRLTEQGVFSTWIPFFSMTDANLRILMKTLRTVFPHIMIWYVPYARNKHAMLMGMKSSPSIHTRFLEQELAKPAVHASLAEVGMDDVYEFLCSYAADGKSTAAYVCDALVNDDNHLYLPYYSPRQAKRSEETVARNIMTLYQMRADITSYLANDEDARGPDRDTLARLTAARHRAMQGLAASYNDNLDDALQWYASALELDSGNVNLRKLYNVDMAMNLADKGFAAIRSGRPSEGTRLVAQAVQSDPGNVVIENWLGMAYMRAGMPDSARSVLTGVVERAPRFIEARWNLAQVYYETRQWEKARGEARLILEQNPRCAMAGELLRLLKTHP
jgi:tetratricopeptide (TPR) repeat protein